MKKNYYENKIKNITKKFEDVSFDTFLDFKVLKNGVFDGKISGYNLKISSGSCDKFHHICIENKVKEKGFYPYEKIKVVVFNDVLYLINPKDKLKLLDIYYETSDLFILWDDYLILEKIRADIKEYNEYVDEQQYFGVHYQPIVLIRSFYEEFGYEVIYLENGNTLIKIGEFEKII